MCETSPHSPTSLGGLSKPLKEKKITVNLCFHNVCYILKNCGVFYYQYVSSKGLYCVKIYRVKGIESKRASYYVIYVITKERRTFEAISLLSLENIPECYCPFGFMHHSF